MKPIHVLLAATLLAASTNPARAALENQVKDHPVPYLAMHGTDPVHWQQWSAATLERARRENKLLFISIGFFSCYWCHVMQRESFRDADIARELNGAYVPVIVDRELEPALDAQMLAFVERYRGSAGWPLNVIVTPEGHPLLGGVYFPRNELLALLRRMTDEWKKDRDALSALARQAALEASAPPANPVPWEPGRWRENLVSQSMELADTLSGGFGSQTKFPMSAQLLSLLEEYARERNARLGEFLLVTLDRMAALGLRDHLSGGFYRYTTEPTWHVPHYEKMLYDQALLAQVYLRAARVFERAEFRTVAFETLDFVLARMRAADGFVSSLSAVDARGVEGAYYLWSEADLQRVLRADELRVAKFVFNMQGTPENGAGHLPIPERSVEQAAATLKLAAPEVQKLLAGARARLLAERDRRSVPVDTKIIASWNALLLVALIEAAQEEQSARFAAAARELRQRLIATLWRGGVLYRTANTPGALDDYACTALALWRYAQHLGGDAERALARTLVARAWALFYRDGAWNLGADSLLPGAGRAALLDDGALPSPSAMLIGVSLDIAGHDADAALRERARAALETGAQLLRDQAFNYASHIGSAERAVQRAP